MSIHSDLRPSASHIWSFSLSNYMHLLPTLNFFALSPCRPACLIQDPSGIQFPLFRLKLPFDKQIWLSSKSFTPQHPFQPFREGSGSSPPTRVSSSGRERAAIAQTHLTDVLTHLLLLTGVSGLLPASALPSLLQRTMQSSGSPDYLLCLFCLV